jgi:hypothetical protein
MSWESGHSSADRADASSSSVASEAISRSQRSDQPPNSHNQQGFGLSQRIGRELLGVDLDGKRRYSLVTEWRFSSRS